MIPALRAGFIVLTDRYIYSLMARAIVRGMDASMDSRNLQRRADARRRLLPAPRRGAADSARNFLARLRLLGIRHGRLPRPGHVSRVSAAIKPRYWPNSTGSAWNSILRRWMRPPTPKSCSRSFRPKSSECWTATSRKESFNGSEASRRDYLHKVFEYAAAATMRRSTDQPIAQPRESTGTERNWGFHPVAANLSSHNGRGFLDRK